MNITKLLLLMALIGFVSCAEEEPITINEPNDPNINIESSVLPSSMKDFSWDLFSKVLEQEEDSKNIVVSPLSVAAALYMTYNGADGSTRAAMSKALALNDMTPDTLNAAFQSLSALLQESSGNTSLKVANAVFWDENRIFPREAFLNPIENQYEAETVRADFESNPDQVLETINSWVNNKTEGRIEKILEELDPREVMFLVNALYFIGDWEEPFAEDATIDRDFKLADGTTIQAPTMFQDNNLKFLQKDEFSAVELEFDDTDYAMQLVLPGSEGNIVDWISSERLNTINESMANEATTGRVIIQLPKFEINYKIQLNNALKALGMEVAFDPSNADFSNIGTVAYGNPYISRVEHKTFLKIDEKGAEGAAVTAVGIAIESLPPSIYFNRPFLIQLLHKPSNTIVFAGLIQNPVEEED